MLGYYGRCFVDLLLRLRSQGSWPLVCKFADRLEACITFGSSGFTVGFGYPVLGDYATSLGLRGAKSQ